MTLAPAALNLANCADEPIHIPGSVQPHGALFAFDSALTLQAWSANAQALTAIVPALGEHAGALGLPADATELLRQAVLEMAEGEALPASCELMLAGREFDCIVHGYDSRIVLELECRPVGSDVVASFALKAHSAIDRLKRQTSIAALLNMAVQQVRQLTGFDRVMAYHFRHDGSGDVVAEAKSDAIDAYLGRRYPASDIPAQARRLYLLNSLRLIADVGYQAVPVLGKADGAALDMSHAVLRSVSPIHIEYLQNMGVQSSMSVSIVVNGALWGMLACHHMTPRQVPYSTRMATDVLAQVLASSVQTVEARAQADCIERAGELSSRMLEAVSQEDNVVAALDQFAEEWREMLGADAFIVSQMGELTVHGEIDPALAAAIVQALPAGGDIITQHNAVADWPQALQPQLGSWVGMLAMSFDASTQGVMVAMRLEQIEQVRWAGKPDKVTATGPLGARLTPRGSFDEWRETVRGSAVPWTATGLTIASQMLAKLSRSVAARNAEIERARTELLAMLGHDLRDPLQAINMAGALLERGSTSETIGRRIQTSSNRMQRLIGHVLDMSRINGGIGLGINVVPARLDQLVRDLVDEVAAAHPGAQFELSIPEEVTIHIDADRIFQVLANLLSNARHHGELGQPVLVSLVVEDGDAVLTVRNSSAPIDSAVAQKLFDPFKHTSLNNQRNRQGVGLGLYIARQISHGHGGSLGYHYDAPHVVFTVRLPLHTN